MAKAYGLNMTDVKKKNRCSVLELIFHQERISRKEIAEKLGLTPAAITLIINDLIEEGLIVEGKQEQAVKRKGRKEVLLHLRSSACFAIGVYINSDSCHILCSNMEHEIVFQEIMDTSDCNCSSERILDRLCRRLNALIRENVLVQPGSVLGIGISTIGKVDMERGISVDSYSVWEKNVNVVKIVEEKTGYPVVLSNNICALACGDSFLSKEKYPFHTVFVKYGPGIGAARYRFENSQSIRNMVSVEMGHMIMEPNGPVCVCGSRGCLETITSYRAMFQSVWNLVSPDQTPIIYERTGGKRENMTIQIYLESYLAGENPTVSVTERSLYYLALALRNAIMVIEPKNLVLYGELFEVEAIRNYLMEKLKTFNVGESVRFSHYSGELEAFGPVATVFYAFFENGGRSLLEMES